MTLYVRVELYIYLINEWQLIELELFCEIYETLSNFDILNPSFWSFWSFLLVNFTNHSFAFACKLMFFVEWELELKIAITLKNHVRPV